MFIGNPPRFSCQFLINKHAMNSCHVNSIRSPSRTRCIVDIISRRCARFGGQRANRCAPHMCPCRQGVGGVCTRALAPLRRRARTPLLRSQHKVSGAPPAAMSLAPLAGRITIERARGPQNRDRWGGGRGGGGGRPYGRDTK